MAGKTGAALSGGAAQLHPRRFRSPLYSPGEAARIVGVSYGRFNSWTKPSIEGHPSSGLVTKVEPWKKLSVPFVGLAEAMVLKELTNHASMGCLRKALSKISRPFAFLWDLGGGVGGLSVCSQVSRSPRAA